MFRNGDKIGYISLNNKDRLEEPGLVLTEFSHRVKGFPYIVRLLEY